MDANTNQIVQPAVDIAIGERGEIVWLGEVRLAGALGTALSLPALIKGDRENLSPTHAAVGRFVCQGVACSYA